MVWLYEIPNKNGIIFEFYIIIPFYDFYFTRVSFFMYCNLFTVSIAHNKKLASSLITSYILELN